VHFGQFAGSDIFFLLVYTVDLIKKKMDAEKAFMYVNGDEDRERNAMQILIN